MGLIAPRLIYEKNVENEVKFRPIFKALEKKFEDERNKRRDQLKLTPKFAGKKKGICTQGYLHLALVKGPG